MRAGIAGADARRLLATALDRAGVVAATGPLTLVAAGKAALPMTAAFADFAGPRVTTGVVAAPSVEAVPWPGVTVVAAGHPLPNSASTDAGRLALDLVAATPPHGCVVVLLSGGASALLVLPAAGLTLDDKIETNRQLLARGLAIHELNAVRKHLSAIKGGRLAASSAAPVWTFAISDVVGPIDDEASVIGSGPTVADDTSFHDALAVLRRHEAFDGLPARVRDLLERGARGECDDTPKPGDARLAQSTFVLVGSRRDSMAACRAQAERLGYSVAIDDAAVVGEARRAGIDLIARARERAPALPRPACIVTSGETTVTVRGRGRGGRNQELALAAATALGTGEGPAVVASVGTDGVDGPTRAAGALADDTSVARAHALGLASPDTFLANNDASAFFEPLGDLIITGPTGTNVGDLQVVLFG